eukprot:985092_1
MSDQPTKKLYHDMDLLIFEKQGRQKCDQNSEWHPSFGMGNVTTSDHPIEGCIVVKRLIVALAYYSRLDTQNSEDGQEIFIAFINDVYAQILDDYAHLVNKHKNLEAINKALIAKDVFDVCEVTKCSFTARHQSRETTQISNVSMDVNVQFYSQLMDSLHFYLIHLFECGLRTTNVDPPDDDCANKEDDDKYFDKQFARISKTVNERRKIRLSFGRFKMNTKFNMHPETGTGSVDTVYMDEVMRHLLYSNIKQVSIKKFAHFVAFHQYCMDSLKEDIKQASHGNIAMYVGDKAVIEAIFEFIEAVELCSSSFNIGLTFYYWPEYEKMDHFDANTDMFNLNDHSGYKVSALFVKQRHVSFKDEIMAYAFISMRQYESIMMKVNEFIKTKSVKAIKAYNEKGMYNHNIVLKYGIPHGSALLSRHLLALFLYTDFTDLCTHFSATFRANKQFEALSAIKARNSKYWWLAKSLRELVELYGESKRGNGNLKGPFYCGVSAVMPFPEFQVRLCGPTSTSYQIEIAINFAGREGIIVQLNNSASGSTYLSGFPCGWLSDFKEEDEVLFMGGHFRIKIESVRILRGKGDQCQNFEAFFGALSKFNSMFNGSFAHKSFISSNEKEIIISLINWILRNESLVDKMDQYVLDTFQSFCQHKAHIVLNCSDLGAFNDEELLDMIFVYGMKRSDVNLDDNFKPVLKEGKANIFGKALFQIFKNIKNIDIYTTNYDGYGQYTLSFAALLDEIEKEHWNQVTIKGVHYYWEMRNIKSWVGALWSESSKWLKQHCAKKGLQVSFRNEVNHKQNTVDCVVITK